MYRKIISILFAALITVIALTQRTWFAHTIHDGGGVALFLSILFTAICAFVPGVPAVVTSAIIGNIYGVWAGTAVILTGSMAAYMVMFFLARFGFSTWARKAVEKYRKIKQYESRFENNTFVTVLVARLIPVIPGTLINILSGLSKISWISFFFATLFAKLPVDLLYTFAGKEMSSNKGMSLLIYSIYLLVALLLTFVYSKRRKKISPEGVEGN